MVNFKPLRKIKVFVLSANGCSSPTFAMQRVVMLDKNIVSHLEDEGVMGENVRWWWDQLDIPCRTFNLTIACMEGKNREPPTFEQYKDELSAKLSILRRFVTRADIAQNNLMDVERIYSEFSRVRGNIENEINFHIEAEKLIKKGVSVNKRFEVQEKLISLACKFSIQLNSMLAIAFFSCLYENNGSAIPNYVRKVLFKKGFIKREQAYNCVSDFHLLEMLCIGIKAGFDVCLVTADKPLSKFWELLELKKCQDGLLLVRPKTTAFPSLNPEQVNRLLMRLSGSSWD